MTKSLDDDIGALLEQILKEPGPAAEEARYHLVSFMEARRADDHYGMAVHHQRVKALLAQYTRCSSCGS